jgi:hypothetical protein
MTDDIVAEIGLDHIIGLAYEVRRAKDGEDTFLQGDIDQCFGERYGVRVYAVGHLRISPGR